MHSRLRVNTGSVLNCEEKEIYSRSVFYFHTCIDPKFSVSGEVTLPHAAQNARIDESGPARWVHSAGWFPRDGLQSRFDGSGCRMVKMKLYFGARVGLKSDPVPAQRWWVPRSRKENDAMGTAGRIVYGMTMDAAFDYGTRYGHPW